MQQPYFISDRSKRVLHNFRLLMQAMAHPGQLYRLETRPLLHDFPALAVAECLMDQEVSFTLAGQGLTDHRHKAIREATGARPAPVTEADFVFIFGPDSQGAVARAKRGTPTFPDHGATLIYSLDRICEADAGHLRARLKGPGIAEVSGIAPQMRGLDLAELRLLGRINNDFPLGVDAFFIDPQGQLMTLPRSTRIEVL
jgi:alpha-D-ribose 1-methylphosphonate 5-triphosphate synthase subunit PhnH